MTNPPHDLAIQNSPVNGHNLIFPKNINSAQIFSVSLVQYNQT